MKILDIFEDMNSPLEGYVDISGLTSLLPDINNPSTFVNAMNKVRLGKSGTLTFAEKTELGNAWISFIGLDDPHKSMVSDKLMAIKDAPQQPQTNTKSVPNAVASPITTQP